MQTVGGQKKPVPNVFEITIRSNVPTGVYEVSAGGLYGLSNPRIFVVGSQDETQEAEPNNSLEKANDLVLGRIVNGTSGSATDVDVYRFQGKRGPTHRGDVPGRRSRLAHVSGGRVADSRRPPTRIRTGRAATRSDGRCGLARRRHLLHQGSRLSLSRRARVRVSAVGGRFALHRLCDAAGRCRRHDRALHPLRPESAGRAGIGRKSRRAPARETRRCHLVAQCRAACPDKDHVGLGFSGDAARFLDLEDAGRGIESGFDSIGAFGADHREESRTTRPPWRRR